MKKKYLALLVFFLIFSCQEKKSNKDNGIEQIEPSPDLEEAVKQPESELLKTSTGKSILVITDKKNSSLNDITIIPLDFPNYQDSLSIQNTDPLHQNVLSDLDGNGYDELYLITQATGSGSYGSIFGFASNSDLSLSPIYIPEITEDDVQVDGNFYGYMGHDSIYFENKKLYRKYPVYKEGDANCCPSGGYNTLHYTLRAGEASWILEIEK